MFFRDRLDDESQEDYVRRMFEEYGFTVTAPNFKYRNEGRRIRVHNDILNKTQHRSVSFA